MTAQMELQPGSGTAAMPAKGSAKLVMMHLRLFMPIWLVQDLSHDRTQENRIDYICKYRSTDIFIFTWIWF
jgi:hypothetical protein